jgi:hypothetical protein
MTTCLQKCSGGEDRRLLAIAYLRLIFARLSLLNSAMAAFAFMGAFATSTTVSVVAFNVGRHEVLIWNENYTMVGTKFWPYVNRLSVPYGFVGL